MIGPGQGMFHVKHAFGTVVERGEMSTTVELIETMFARVMDGRVEGAREGDEARRQRA